ncbi:MAG: TonB-dependent receptor [Myxococcales bacterium]|nr:TonB-dependent receptor [Myxococcales bacterium]
MLPRERAAVTPARLSLLLVTAWIAPRVALADEPSSPAPAPTTSPPALAAAGQAAAEERTDVEEGSPYEEEEVSIIGTKVQETSGSAHVIRPKQLERFEYSDPHQVLMGVPGVYVRGEDGFGLRPNIGMRGAISDRSKKITLMEDGVLFGPAPYSAPAAYYFPMITRMYSVRVVKGPSAIAYGPHTVAGAIDLVTAPIPEGEHVYADVAFGMYLSRKAHVRVSSSGDTFGVLLEGVHEANDGFKHIDGLDADTGFSRNEVMGKARYSFGSAEALLHELELKLGFANENSNETYLGLTDADFEVDPYRRYAASQLDRMEWWRSQIALTHTATRGDDLELKSTFYRHDLTRTWRKVNAFRGAAIADVLADPEAPRNAIFYGVLTGEVEPSTSEETLMIGPNQRVFVSQGFQTKLDWRPKTGPVSHRIEIGARIHNDSIRRLHTQDGFLVRGSALEPTGEPTETTADNEASTLALAGWAIHAGTWGPVTITAGARVESIQGKLEDRLAGTESRVSQGVLLPGAGAFVALPAGFGLLGGVYQGFSPVPPTDAPNPRPEKSLNVEWGARWSPERLIRIEAIGFYNGYSNLSNICTFSSGCVAEGVDEQNNAGAATVLGLEGFADVEIELMKDLTLPARVAYTFTHATFDNTFTSADPLFGDVAEGDDVPYIPAHQLSATAGLEHRYVGGNVSGTFVSEMREVAGAGEPPPGEATDASFLLDASIYARPLSFLTFYAVGRNLLDMAYVASRRPFGARPGAPILLQVGAKVTY